MIRMLFLVSLVTLIAAGNTYGYADTWTAFAVPESANPLPDGYPGSMIFTLENNILTLNTPYISTVGGSTSEYWALTFSGNWAVCGTIDASGNSVLDPYARFVADDAGWRIAWAPETPQNYSTSLMLGSRFNGDGAVTYQPLRYTEPSGDPVTGTLVVKNYLPRMPDLFERYTPVSHVFENVKYDPTPPIPEPSGALAVLAVGITAAAGCWRRIKFMRARW